jgi:vitamin B12 transporter
VSASAGWQVTPAFYASLSVQSLGDRTDLYFQPVPPYATEQIALKSYAVLNAYAEYKLLHNRLRLFVDARNLTDTDFTEVYGYTAQGLNVTGGFRIHW